MIDIEGSFDGLERGALVGWARFDGMPVSIVAIIDNEPLQEVFSNQPRSDLAKAGYGDFAFQIPVPPRFLDGQEHSVELQLADIGLTILGGKRTLKFDGVQQAEPASQPASTDDAPALAGTHPDGAQQAEPALADMHLGGAEVFDAAFYRQANPDVAQVGIDPFTHYTSFGWRELRDPCAGLPVRSYIADHPELLRIAEPPLAHWMNRGMPPVSPKPRRTSLLSSLIVEQDAEVAATLIDPLYVYTSNSGVIRSQEAEFVQASGNRATPFNPLFDCAHYSRVSGVRGSSNALRLHYLQQGWKERLSPHPLFDAKFYEGQLPAPLTEPALVHYLREGWRSDLSPCVLFDPAHYRNKAGIGRDVNPLIHYMLLALPKAEPNFLFSDARFSALAAEYLSEGDNKKSPLELFLTRRNLQKISTHLFFEPMEYLMEIDKLADGPVKTRLQRATLKLSPLNHYLEHGAMRDLSTSRYFWPDFYRAQLLAAGVKEEDLPPDLLQHYLRDGGKEEFAPNPLISLPHLSAQRSDLNLKEDEAVDFILRQPVGYRPEPSPLFDRKAYISLHEDIRLAEICPVEHFLNHGMKEERSPNRFYSRTYANRFWGLSPKRNALENYFLSHALEPKTRILFTSHDASRTGAPGIILRLIKDLSKIPGVECFCILDRGGELLPEFASVSHAHVLEDSVYQVGPDNALHRKEIGDLLEGVTIDYAICNSLETRHIAQYLDEHGIRTIMLMHEVPDLYPTADIEFALDKLSHIIFPSKFIRDRMLGKVDLDEDFYSVIGQGLLNDDFGHWPRNIARDEVLDELSLPQDAYVVLGCGTVDFRKGIDHFIATATKVLKLAEQSKGPPVYFIWLGHGDRRPGTPAGFVIDQIKLQGLQDRVRFVGPRPDMPKYMAACDVFYMSSRADPFPCVIHEALASALPVVYFREGGGAGELVQEDGVGVTIGDIDTAAEAIFAYRQDEKNRLQVGQRARDRILAQWRSPDYADKLVDRLTQTFGESQGLTHIRSCLARASGQHNALTQGATRSPVYFLSPDWSTSGVNTYTRNLIKGLRDLGWDAKLLFTRGARTKFYTDSDGHVVFPDVPYEFVYPEKNEPDAICRALRAFLVDAPPCIVVPNYDYIASAIAPVVSPKSRWVGIAHSDHIEHYEHVYRLGHYWDAIVAVSGQVRDGIAEINATLAQKTSRIFCGVSQEEAPINRQRDPSKIRLIYAGRMVTEQKQISRYIELAEALEAMKVPYELNMVGDGNQLPVLRQAAVRLPGLKVHGRCSSDKTLDLMRQNDIFVLLSDYEGLPMSLVEALAGGLVPIVYPIRSGIGEVLTNGLNGIIAKEPSIELVAQAVKQLHEDRSKLETLSAESIRSIDRLGLSLEYMSKAYSELFEDVFKNANAGNQKRMSSFAWRSADGFLPPIFADTFL